MIVGLMMSCKDDDSSKPTAPNIPVFPEGQSSENSSSMGFYSEQGNGEFGTNTDTKGEFTVSVPAGEYLLTYGASNGGTYYVAFRATAAAVLHIGLRDNTQVLNIAVQKGKIINESQKQWVSNAVTLFAWPDGPDWNSVFQSDGSTAIVLLGNGQSSTEDWVLIGETTPYNLSSEPAIDSNMISTFNTNPSDPLAATITTTNNWTVKYFGSKDSSGMLSSVNFVCAFVPSGEILTAAFDGQERISKMSRGDGKILNIEWENNTLRITDGTLSCPNTANFLFDGKPLPYQHAKLSRTGEQCKAFYDNVLKACPWVTTGAGIHTSLSNFKGALGAWYLVFWQWLTCKLFEIAAEGCDDYQTCDSTMKSGGVGQVSYTVELGKSSGVMGLEYEMYTVPDQIVIVDAGAWGKVLYDTGCKGGGQTVQIPYSMKNSTSVRVEVWGDCTNQGSTQWDFKLLCP